jgi:hypothetical protein
VGPDAAQLWALDKLNRRICVIEKKETAAEDFPEGPYAVTALKLKGDPKGSVFEVWQRLFELAKPSKHKWRRIHELEEVHDPGASEEDLVLDLYLPIEESTLCRSRRSRVP